MPTLNRKIATAAATAAARLLGVDARTSRRWASGERDIPPPAVRFLRYLIATKKTGEQAMRVLGG